MNTSAKVIKKVITRTVQIELDEQEYQDFLKVDDYSHSKSGHNWYESHAFGVIASIVRAIGISESKTT